ncbi:MAG: hypothetical protein AB1631_28255 [Acidobacteriota bacterium]
MRRQKNFRAVLIAFAALAAACGHDAPSHSPAETFVVLREDRAPDGSNITVSIKVSSQSLQSQVRAAAEVAIEKYRSEYAKVTVKSFTRDDATSVPLAVTTLEGGQVRHVFNSTGPQKIPTH